MGACIETASASEAAKAMAELHRYLHENRDGCQYFYYSTYTRIVLDSMVVDSICYQYASRFTPPLIAERELLIGNCDGFQYHDMCLDSPMRVSFHSDYGEDIPHDLSYSQEYENRKKRKHA